MRKKRRVMVVDDEPMITLSLGELLKDDGYDVTTHESATNAIKELKKHNLDVVVTDISLGEENGIDLVSWINENSHNTPVILITGNPGLETAVRGLRSGAFDYISKPVTREILKPALERAISARRRTEEIHRLQRILDHRHKKVRPAEQVAQDQELRDLLPHAIREGQLEVYYQPRVDARTMELRGLEALMRWKHPVLGQVSPARFIPVAERSGQILVLGHWLLHEVARQILAWKDAGHKTIPVSVNISARQFERGDIVGLVREVLESDDRLTPDMFELEITETVILTGVDETARILESLKAVGVRLALDDFGTGYSSLSYLKNFPFDCLKIDQAFIRNLENDRRDMAITRTIVELAHNLGLSVVAEGVETHAQADIIRSFGCDEIQGYLVARPQPALDITPFLSGSAA
jgi:EAL domain-containing protein (putative c-di-GMP-specific phosphodiesterase class I)/CheY-like chemotaxis protein